MRRWLSFSLLCFLCGCGLVGRCGKALLTEPSTEPAKANRPSSQIQLLRSYEPTTQPKAVPEQFYSYFGFRDWYRYPLVYPYSLNCVDTISSDTCGLFDDSGVVDFDAEHDSRQLDIDGITHLNFDANLLLTKDSDYTLFEWRTQKQTRYDSETALLTAARKLGYHGSALMTVKQYDGLFDE